MKKMLGQGLTKINKSKGVPRGKMVSERRCVGCREMKGKNLLVRVVRSPIDGGFSVDETGKAAGRGAYLCKGSHPCLAAAIKSKAFERSFKSKFSQEIYRELEICLMN